MTESVLLSAFIGMIISALGFFVKKWIYRLEKKLDRICENLQTKVDRVDCATRAARSERHKELVEKEFEIFRSAIDEKTDWDRFLKHTHTEKGITLS